MLLSDEEFQREFALALADLANQNFTVSFAAAQSLDDAPIGLRMSSIGNCARQLFYRLKYPEQVTFAVSWQTVLGYAGQDIIANTLENMGYILTDKEKAVFFAIPGHIDGKLTGKDLHERKAIWDAKLRNSFAYSDLVKNGLPKADVGMYLQQQGYIAAEKADLGILTIMPFDLTDTRSRLKLRKIDQVSGVFRIVLTPDPEAHQLIEDRVGEITYYKDKDKLPAREFDPLKEQFPCTFCPFHARCVKDGDTDYAVAPIPEKWLE